VKVLGIDTTTSRGSVALVASGELLGEVRLSTQASHSRRLLPAVAFLLDALGLEAAAIEGLAVTTGPGSFTGLRIGISTVQGLGLALGRPCLGVSALDVVAARAEGEGEILAVVMDAWRGEVYGAVYDAAARPLAAPVVEAPASFLARVPPGRAVFVGEGALRYRELIERERPDAGFSRRSLYLAGTLARLAEPRLEAGLGAGPEALRPLYLRPADARLPVR
jgi:tRNA threonylcarbamoyladenosine biosynthesis protein TsaB